MSKPFAIASLSAFVIFVVVDFIWLSVALKHVYKPELGALLRPTPVIWAAVLFYVLYGVGLALLVIRPALGAGSLLDALWMGALFGLVAYGTYDLTNQATVQGWSVLVTFVDMAWGGLLTGLAATAGVAIAQRFA